MKKRKPLFPVLESKIAETGITKKSIAKGLDIDQKTMSQKLTGKTQFTLKEIRYIHSIFPDVSVEKLFGINK